MRRSYVVLALILAGSLFQAPSLFGEASPAATPKSEDEINVTADSMGVKGGGTEIEGKGNVELKRREMTLKADEIWVNRETQDMEAKGNVSVDDPQWKLKRGERVRFNLGKETGEIEKGEVFVEAGHLSMSGRRLEKFAGQTYHIDDGFFTTCLCESGPPTWKILAEEMDLKRDGEGVVKHGWFYIMDVPVLYIPYAVFPLRTERQTGFLFPKLGYSGRNGFLYQQPFFWAISKSTDATFGVDVETRSRVGFLAELRTILGRDTRGEINISYFNESMRRKAQADVGDSTIADTDIPVQRWSVVGSHRQGVASGWQTYSDIALFSDDLFTREMVHHFNLADSQERDFKTSRYSSSRLGFYRSWGDMSLQGEGAFFQDFIQKDQGTFQKTPQILFRGRNVLGNTPFELRWQAEGVNYFRQKGADGLRLDLRPELVLPFNLGSYLGGSLGVAPRETVYHLYSTQVNQGAVDRNKSRTLVEVRGTVGTSIGRVFDFGEGSYIQKIKHAIEPEVSYLFIPRTHQSDIPIMDGADRINRRNLVTFSLTNRFWGKFVQESLNLPEDRDAELVTSPSVGDIRELGKLRLALSYDVDRERKGGDTLSDLDMNIRVTPMDYMALGFDAGVDPGAWRLSQAAAVFSIFDPRPITRRVLDRDFMQPNSFNLTYRFINKTNFGFLAEDANIDPTQVASSFYCGKHLLDPRCQGFHKDVIGQLSANFVYHATDHLLFLLNSAYNVRDSRFAGLRATVKLLSQCECWTLGLTLKQEISPSKTSFTFDFNLLGLGSQNKGQSR